jgi:hypothetical protein
VRGLLSQDEGHRVHRESQGILVSSARCQGQELGEPVGSAQQLLTEEAEHALVAATIEQRDRPENLTMYHAIEFRVEFTVDLEISPKSPLERLLFGKGARVRAQIKPYVAETLDGPVEVADLFFEDGTATRSVPFAYFSFVDEHSVRL